MCNYADSSSDEWLRLSEIDEKDSDSNSSNSDSYVCISFNGIYILELKQTSGSFQRFTI